MVILDNSLPWLLWSKRVQCQHKAQRTLKEEDWAKEEGVVCLTRKIRCAPEFASWVLDQIQDTFHWRTVRRTLLNAWRTHLHHCWEHHPLPPQVWKRFSDDQFLCPLAALPHVHVLKHIAFNACGFL